VILLTLSSQSHGLFEDPPRHPHTNGRDKVESIPIQPPATLPNRATSQNRISGPALCGSISRLPVIRSGWQSRGKILTRVLLAVGIALDQARSIQSN